MGTELAGVPADEVLVVVAGAAADLAGGARETGRTGSGRIGGSAAHGYGHSSHIPTVAAVRAIDVDGTL